MRVKQTSALSEASVDESFWERREKERRIWMLWGRKKEHFCGSLNLKGNTAFLEAVFAEMLYHRTATGRSSIQKLDN